MKIYIFENGFNNYSKFSIAHEYVPGISAYNIKFCKDSVIVDCFSDNDIAILGDQWNFLVIAIQFH